MNRVISSEVFNMDCMEGMKQFPDKHFNLAIVDPPYGIGRDEQKLSICKNPKHNRKEHKKKEWDSAIPNENYFKELFRVSKNQVVWGGNYMTDCLAATSSWIFWDKGTGENDFADGELAWTSFGGALRKVTKSWVGANAKDEADRIHPTQKPIYLYSWIYAKYLSNGGKVIDTHLGSGSNRIAANKAGNIDFTGFELDKDYYEAQEKRWKGFIAQTRLF